MGLSFMSSVAKGLVAKLMASKVTKTKAEQTQVLVKRVPIGPVQSLSDILGEVIPPKTEFEKAWEIAQAQRVFNPHKTRGPDPRKPWAIPGGAIVQRISEIQDGDGPKTSQEAKAQVLKGQERSMLNNIHAKAAQGKRLTKAERKLKGKWDLARIVAGLRPKQSD